MKWAYACIAGQLGAFVVCQRPELAAIAAVCLVGLFVTDVIHDLVMELRR